MISAPVDRVQILSSWLWSWTVPNSRTGTFVWRGLSQRTRPSKWLLRKDLEGRETSVLTKRQKEEKQRSGWRTKVPIRLSSRRDHGRDLKTNPRESRSVRVQTNTKTHPPSPSKVRWPTLPRNLKRKGWKRNSDPGGARRPSTFKESVLKHLTVNASDILPIKMWVVVFARNIRLYCKAGCVCCMLYMWAFNFLTMRIDLFRLLKRDSWWGNIQQLDFSVSSTFYFHFFKRKKLNIKSQ